MNIKPLTTQRQTRTPWWQWLNVLSLDAPIVALVWHVGFARFYGVAVDLLTASLLGLSVWMIYVMDRLLDVWRTGLSESTRRHAFHSRHGRVFVCGMLLALGVAVVLTMRAEQRLWRFGGVMLGLSLGYAWLVHRRVFRVPKEALCGGMFSVGVLVSLFITPVPWISLVLFALVCTANCVVISYAEGEIAKKYDSWIRVSLAALVACCVYAGGVIHLLMGVSSLGLFGLHLVRGGREMKRVLADALLLTPLVGWPWL